MRFRRQYFQHLDVREMIATVSSVFEADDGAEIERLQHVPFVFKLCTTCNGHGCKVCGNRCVVPDIRGDQILH